MPAKPKPPKVEPNKRKLSPTFIDKSLKPRDVPYLIWDEQQRGLAVRVEPSGYASYKAIYRYGGRPRWFHIGAVDAIGLSKARDVARGVMNKVADGLDPAALRKAERSAGTFAELHEMYLERYAKKENKSWKQGDWLVRKYLLPKWSKLAAAAVSRDDVEAMMARIKAPVTANQVLANASAIFSWAIKKQTGGVKINPCVGVDRNKTKHRERILSDTEVPLFWKEFDKLGTQGATLKVLLLLGQRPGETALMRTEHIVDNWWSMPGDPVPELRWKGTKNGASHRVWISAPAKAIIAAEEPDGFVFAGPRTGPVTDLDARMRDICKKLGLTSKADRVTPHDLRHCNGSAITRLGFSRDAMNRIQNHRDGGIADVYDQYQYAVENQRIMEAVANHFMALATGQPLESNVVQLALST
jgi:integrase